MIKKERRNSLERKFPKHYKRIQKINNSTLTNGIGFLICLSFSLGILLWCGWREKEFKEKKGEGKGRPSLAVYPLSHRPYASFFRFQFPDPYPVEKKEERRLFFFLFPLFILLLQFILSTAFGSWQTKESCFLGHGLGRGIKPFFFPH